MAKLQGDTDFEKLKDLCLKTHKEQAVWFLNAFWDTHQGEAENFWKYVQKLHELDPKKEKGNELEDWNQHRFLEFFKNTMTVQQMRDSLRSTGAINETAKLKLVPLTHWLLFHYKVDWHALVNAAQGDNRKEIDEAQQKLDEVQVAFRDSEAKATEAKEREAAAKSAEAEAKSREAAAKSTEESAKTEEVAAVKSEEQAKTKAAESKKREDELKAAKDELEAALRELKAQEDAYNQKTEDLKKKSEDETIGLVTRNKAKNELAQHLGEDPLPLRKAKITQEAAVKKADKAATVAADARAVSDKAADDASAARAAAEKSRQAAEAAAAEATAARTAAEGAAQEASDAKAAAEAALEDMARKLEEAEAYFNEVKSKPGSAHGALWWIDRELHEARAYLPEKRGGYKKAK